MRDRREIAGEALAARACAAPADRTILLLPQEEHLFDEDAGSGPRWAQASQLLAAGTLDASDLERWRPAKTPEEAVRLIREGMRPA